MSTTLHRPDQPHPGVTSRAAMGDVFEHLDVGVGGTPHPVLDKILVASAGVAVGALVVTVGPGLVMGSAAPTPAQSQHRHTVVFRATCTESRCHAWTVTGQQATTLVTHISPGPNAAVAMYYLTHQGCP